MKVYRYSDGAWLNSILLVYVTAVAVLGIYVAAQSTVSVVGALLFFVGAILVCHALVLAAYFAHECMHNSIFKSTRTNDRFGSSLCFFVGASFYPYARLKDKHMRHHSERRDVLTIDLRNHLAKHQIQSKVVSGLQWFHLPAAELYSAILGVTAPFFINELKIYRSRIILVLICYSAAFVLLSLVSLGASLAYLFGMFVCYAILGFMDTFQHTYEIKLSLNAKKEKADKNRVYEEENTYSNILSTRFPFLNLLVLNFCYHNIHHQKSGEPWYRLPKLHQAQYGGACPQEVSLGSQLKNFHKFRIERLKLAQSADSKSIGASGVSFLVGV